MKEDVPIEIEIVEAGQPRPQRPGPEPRNIKGLRPFSTPGVVCTIRRASTSGTCERDHQGASTLPSAGPSICAIFPVVLPNPLRSAPPITST